MSGLKVISKCPLGCSCEKVVTLNDEQVIERCVSYIQFDGVDAQGNDSSKWMCAIFQAVPKLLIEVSGTNRGQTAAIEDFRNKSVAQQHAFLNIIASAVQQQIAHDNYQNSG